MEICGYSITEKLSESQRSIVYRGSKKTGETAALKLPRQTHPSSSDLDRIRHEYEIYSLFRHNKIVSPIGLEPHNRSLALILEDFNSSDLTEENGRGAHDLVWFLDIGVQLTSALQAIHTQQIIYNNLNPANILYRPNTGRIKLIDFSLASSAEKVSSLYSVNQLPEESLPYISPEQTGRLNQALDYRSDFYSLGATLYQLLLGSVPFSTDDPVEQMHSHLARTVVPPHELDATIPVSISRIILKLLDKSTEKRYQSSSGLTSDLMRCLIEMKDTRSIVDFPIGQKDHLDLPLPESFCGRGAERAAILDTYDKVKKGGQQIFLITGEAGIGKTSLVNEVLAFIEADGGTVLRSTAQKNNIIPYNAVIDGLQDLARRLLLSNNEEISRWQGVFLKSMGNRAYDIVNVIPEMELIIGKQKQVAGYTGVKTDGFGHLLQSFITAFADQLSTLVFFIDDLHWADQESQELISELIGTSSIGLFIGCIPGSTLERLAAYEQKLKPGETTATQTLNLASLTRGDISSLLSEFLGSSFESTSLASELCLNKTAGNPFFLKQLLRKLYKTRHLTFDHSNSKWTIDLEYLETAKVMSNVGEMLVKHLYQYNKNTLSTLKPASCIGQRFSLKLLKAITGKTEEEILNELADPIADGLIIVTDAHTSPRRWLGHEKTFQFSHDQIHKATYLLIPVQDHPHLHWRIGQAMLRTLSDKTRSDKIYDIVTHLNKGRSLATKDKDRFELAELNLLLAKKAGTSAGSDYHYQFAQTAVGLLSDETDWENRYALTLAVHTELLKAASYKNISEETELIFAEINNKAQSILDKTPACLIRIQSYKSANRLNDVILTGREVLSKLGVKIPNYPTKTSARRAMLCLKFMLQGKKATDLTHLPEMTDPHQRAVMDILLEMVSAAYYTRQNLLPIISHQIIQKWFKYGSHKAIGIMGYTIYSFLLCGLNGTNIDRGYELGQLVLGIQKQNRYKSSAITIFLINNLVVHWKKHLNSTLAPLIKSFHLSKDIGNRELAASSAYNYCVRLFFLGQNLTNLELELMRQHDTIAALKQQIPLYRLMIFQQSIANLLGKNKNPSIVDGEFYDSAKLLSVHRNTRDYTTLFMFHSMSMMHAYLFGEYDMAVSQGSKALKLVNNAVASVYIPNFYFYHGLSLLGMYHSQSTLGRKTLLRKIDAGLKNMRLWASTAPENYQHKYHLLVAERNRVLNKKDEAAEHYDRAIKLAAKNGYLQEEGLIYERAAHFYFELGRLHIAKPYLNEALSCYSDWGATQLIDYITRKYSAQDFEKSQPVHHNTGFHRSSIIAEDTNRFDILSMVKASRAFIGEVELNELLKKMIAILIENSGAQKGCLLLDIENEWMLKVKAKIDGHHVEIVDYNLNDTSGELSQKIVNYVIRSQKTVVLHNAHEQGLFTSDEYVRKNRSKSILCMPVVHHGEIVCLMYLENNLTAGAFHSDKLEILKLMASQAAISIKNSMLYEELEGTVQALHAETAKRKQAQIQLLHADKLSAMGRISASIAHEFGNPLIGIKYLLDDLTNRSHLSDEDHLLIEVGLEECDRMKKLMDDLHDLHRPSSGLKSRFNLNESVKNVLLFQRKSFKNSGVSVITELADNLPDIVAIEDQITQVIVNMAINGGDAMAKQGGILSVKTTHDRNLVTLKMSDTGHGITPENQGHIFEPFFSTKEEMDGTGLGLAIAYSIVKSHGGDITFTSATSEGSTFTIHLPINASSTTDAGASDQLQLDHLPVQQLANLRRQNQNQ